MNNKLSTIFFFDNEQYTQGPSNYFVDYLQKLKDE